MMVAAWRLVMPLCSLVAASADNCLLCTESTFFERQLKWLLTVKKKCHYRGGYAWVGNAPSAPGEEIFFWRKFFFWSQSNDKKYYNIRRKLCPPKNFVRLWVGGLNYMLKLTYKSIFVMGFWIIWQISKFNRFCPLLLET